MDLNIENIISKFKFAGKVVSYEPYGEGHINQTFRIVLDNSKRYILQRINDSTFPNVEQLMSNISLVCEFLSTKTDNEREYMHVIKTLDGKLYYKDDSGYWRVLEFIEGTICLQSAETLEDFYQSAVGFGKFQSLLADFPVNKLHETIKDFHNTPKRYEQFIESIKKDSVGRVSTVQKEIDYILSKKDECSILQKMADEGELPLRVTHNDTKLNNVLLDEKTRKALCVIDLDTVMPGLTAIDFGDAIRFGATKAKEDEKDLNKVHLELDLYETFVKGFVTECKDLTDKEIESLPLGAKTITMEQAVRFLKDYIDGDTYYTTHYENQNLYRARTQIKLVQEMDEKWDDMISIVNKYRTN